MRVVTLTLLLSCVSPCVAVSPGRVLAGVRWGFSPWVFRSLLVLWYVLASHALRSDAAHGPHTHVFSSLKCPTHVMY